MPADGVTSSPSASRSKPPLPKKLLSGDFDDDELESALAPISIRPPKVNTAELDEPLSSVRGEDPYRDELETLVADAGDMTRNAQVLAEAAELVKTAASQPPPAAAESTLADAKALDTLEAAPSSDPATKIAASVSSAPPPAGAGKHRDQEPTLPDDAVVISMDAAMATDRDSAPAGMHLQISGDADLSPEELEAIVQRQGDAPGHDPRASSGEIELRTEAAVTPEELEALEADRYSVGFEGAVAADSAAPAEVDDSFTTANWFEAEAEAETDLDRRSRLLLAASELFAGCGDNAAAARTAQVSTQANRKNHLASRQVRTLAAVEADWDGVLRALEIESRTSPTAESKAHAAHMSAEIHRVLRDDSAAASKKLDQAQRALPADPRAPALKLALLLGADTKPAKFRWPESALSEKFDAALEALAILRSPSLGAPHPLPITAFHQLRLALGKADIGAASTALEHLTQVPELRQGALWLNAALCAPTPGTRAKAIDSLNELLSLEPTAHVHRALAARAVEQGDYDRVQLALAASAQSDIEGKPVTHEANEPACPFSTVDRVALATLIGAGKDHLAAGLKELADQEGHRALASAIAMGSQVEVDIPPVEAAVTSALALGRGLAQTESSEHLPELLDKFTSAEIDGQLAGVIGLELALATGNQDDLSKRLSTLASSQAESSNEGVGGRFLSASLQHARGQFDKAQADYEALLSSSVHGLTATRALANSSDATRLAQLLSDAGVGKDPIEQGLLNIEAALRLGAAEASPEESSALLADAAQMAPSLPFSYELGYLSARLAGDGPAALSWLRDRRKNSPDPSEQALDLVREALLVADDDQGEAAALLQSSTGIRPEDVALHELHERLSPSDGDNRASWRESAAEAAVDERTQERLRVEAALEFERRGDLASAARLARAGAALGSELGKISAERLAGADEHGRVLEQQLVESAARVKDPAARREIYERLQGLSANRGADEESLKWHAAILGEDPSALSALRALEKAKFSEGAIDDIAPVASTLARVLGESEADAHARLGVLALGLDSTDARSLVEEALARDPVALWALRAAVGQREGSPKQRRLANEMLSTRTDRELDRTALLLRASQSARSLGDHKEALDLVSSAVEISPDHIVALTEQAALLQELEQWEDAADCLEALAQSSHVEAHRIQHLLAAGELWLSRTEQAERGMAALERAVEAGDDSVAVFERLKKSYIDAGNQDKLATLLDQRIENCSDPVERIQLEISRGQALADIGDAGAARRALTSALDANPDHADALEVFANLCATDGDWRAAEQAWIRLARVLDEPARQAEMYMRLADLYFSDLPNPKRAELCYREVLKRQPGDVPATTKLVQIYGRLEEPQQAVELQLELLERSGSTDEKCERTVALASVYEEFVGDMELAAQTLERARKSWPQDPRVLRALATFFQRKGDETSLNSLLDRAQNDARRALSTGRFDPDLFGILATIAELRGGEDAAELARATLAALEGGSSSVDGAGALAGSSDLDELLAPTLLTAPVRLLIAEMGGVLDEAYPMDLKALGAHPVNEDMQATVGQIQQIAVEFGVSQLEVLVSSSIGPKCIATRSEPAQVVIGEELLAHPNALVVNFALFQSLTILRVRGAAIARLAPVEIWPMVAALISVLSPSWVPQNVEARKFADARRRLQSAIQSPLSPQLGDVALEVATAVGNRASQLATAVNQWGNRAALLAVGDPSAAITAIALSNRAELPESGADRLKWIVRNAEARDLAVFSVSDSYAASRRQIGVS
ncbi:MAG: hypothetical protein HRU17_05885 [Polyangiaceae bacterium]|nr:hypothetical protein [Polyangiaceae bacterium]